jgi:hypothetical protein
LKKKFDVYLLRMTLLKFVLFSLICWFALYAFYQYTETSLILKFIIGCSFTIILMNVIRSIFNNEPRLYYLTYSFGLVPTIVFIGYSLFLMFKFGGTPQYIYIIGLYSIAVFSVVLTVQDTRVQKNGVRSRIIRIYNVHNENVFIDDKVINAYKKIHEPSEKASKIEKALPFFPIFIALFSKSYHSYVETILMTCLMFFQTVMIIELGTTVYNFVHLFSTIRKMEK